MIETGKKAPPRIKFVPAITQLMGSPFFNTIINDADKMPKLTKMIMESMKIIKKAKIFKSFILKPKKNTPAVKMTTSCIRDIRIL